VANFFVPVVLSLAGLGMAEATALFRGLQVSSPVLAVRAHLGVADALAVLN
jgi:hypothetical protein